MINLKFGLFWSDTKMSYLRYLTFKSLRHFHPDAEIELYISSKSAKDGFNWSCEKQDFQRKEFAQVMTLDDLKPLNITIQEFNGFEQYAANFQSDFFRWWWLKKNSGFYLDTDQIILKSFNCIDLTYDFIYSAYNAPSCGLYTPVGAIGANCNSQIVQWINAILPKYYSANSYNSLGPFMLRSVLATRKWDDKMLNTGSELFYPALDSGYVPALYYNHDYTIEIEKRIDNAVALHWYGGHPASQSFNASFTEDDAKSSLNLLSTILRDKKII